MKIDRPRPTRAPGNKTVSGPALFLLALTTSIAPLGATPASAAAPSLTLYAFEQPHMGTLFRIKLYAPSKQEAQVAATAAFNRINELNQKLSDYLPHSELNQLAASPSQQTSQTQQRPLCRPQQGASYRPGLRRRLRPHHRLLHQPLATLCPQKNSPHPATTRRRPSPLRIPNLVLDPLSQTATLKVEGMFLDLGGIAKGFAADAALDVLQKHGITRAAIAAGGDIRLGEPPPDSPQGWEIPVLGMDRDEEAVTTKVHLKNAAISTSGDREQFVEIDGTQYSHIVNPGTGLGLTRRITATVIAPNATTSDSYATTLCILGPAALPLEPGIEALILTRNPQGTDTLTRSPGFPRSN